MNLIIQQETTGCAIASVANIVNLPYAQVQQRANALGIFASDTTLFSATKHIVKLLASYKLDTKEKIAFTSWQQLPDTALVALNYHQENNVFIWHWAVFKRQDQQELILDSAVVQQGIARQDLHNMHPKWFIQISAA